MRPLSFGRKIPVEGEGRGGGGVGGGGCLVDGGGTDSTKALNLPSSSSSTDCQKLNNIMMRCVAAEHFRSPEQRRFRRFERQNMVIFVKNLF